MENRDRVTVENCGNLCVSDATNRLKAVASNESMPYNAEYMKRVSPTKVTITPEGTVIEGLTLQEIKDLVGLNGHTNIGVRAPRASSVKSSTSRISNGEPDYVGFRKALTDKGKKFIDALKLNPNGILADDLAAKMGYQNATQIAGTAGGGMSRTAPRFGVDLDNVYTRDTTFKNGVRQTLYKPGKDITRI
jgi:hypothetical protein